MRKSENKINQVNELLDDIISYQLQSVPVHDQEVKVKSVLCVRGEMGGVGMVVVKRIMPIDLINSMTGIWVKTF